VKTHPMKEDIDMERPKRQSHYLDYLDRLDRLDRPDPDPRFVPGPEHQSHYLDAFIAGLDPDPLYVTETSCCDLACYEDSDCTCDGCKAIDADLAAFVAEYGPEPPTRIFLWIGVAVVVAAILLWVTLR